MNVDGPLAIGYGDGARLSGCVVLPGSEIALGTVLCGDVVAGVRG